MCCQSKDMNHYNIFFYKSNESKNKTLTILNRNNNNSNNLPKAGVHMQIYLACYKITISEKHWNDLMNSFWEFGYEGISLGVHIHLREDHLTWVNDRKSLLWAQLHQREIDLLPRDGKHHKKPHMGYNTNY